MIKRLAESRVRALASQFPAILILGPRQCGKTTLAQSFIRGNYFDLEKPSDYQVFANDIEFALRRLKGPVVLDEAQTLPHLFPVLRSLIDEARKTFGRFFLLGSVNPELVRSISESLAGRIGILELTPFLFAEVAAHGHPDLTAFWVKGGFPDAFLARNEATWRDWHENYLRMILERDVARQGLKLTPVQLRRLMVMLAHLHGGLLNASDLGRSLGITYHTVERCLDVLEGHFLVRRLEPYFANIGKRLVKAPKVYLRDTGILHYLLGVGNERQLLESPRRGHSWEGLMIEQIIGLESLAHPGSGFCFYRTHAGAEIDLLVERGSRRIGFEFKCGASTGAADVAHLKTGLAEGIIHEGFLVYLGERNFALNESIQVVPAVELTKTVWPGFRAD